MIDWPAPHFGQIVRASEDPFDRDKFDATRVQRLLLIGGKSAEPRAENRLIMIEIALAASSFDAAVGIGAEIPARGLANRHALVGNIA